MRRWLIWMAACVLFVPGLCGAQNIKDGYGKRTLADGSVYEGQFKDGDFEGKGTLTYPNGQQYTGEFKFGLFDGEGVLVYSDGSKYEGQFREGALNGQGTITYADGTQYKGSFKDGDIDTTPPDTATGATGGRRRIRYEFSF